MCSKAARPRIVLDSPVRGNDGILDRLKPVFKSLADPVDVFEPGIPARVALEIDALADVLDQQQVISPELIEPTDVGLDQQSMDFFRGAEPRPATP